MFWSGIILYIMIMYLPTSVSLFKQMSSQMNSTVLMVSPLVVLISIASYAFTRSNKSRMNEYDFLQRYKRVYAGVRVKDMASCGIYFTSMFFLRRLIYVVIPLSLYESGAV